MPRVVMPRLLPGLFILPALLAACAPAPAPDPASSAPATPPSSVPAATQAPSAVSSPPALPSTAPATPPVAAPTALASASAATAASAPPAAEEKPLPAVKVANIGIHIGGGPNDNATKEPFKKSVQPHYDEMRRCWARVDGQKGDISVELRVERDGGKARVKPNKTTFKYREFNDCIYQVFEAIDFLKPRTGTTVLNFSLRFTPEK
jgi:hypothetical protein